MHHFHLKHRAVLYRIFFGDHRSALMASPVATLVSKFRFHSDKRKAWQPAPNLIRGRTLRRYNKNQHP